MRASSANVEKRASNVVRHADRSAGKLLREPREERRRRRVAILVAVGQELGEHAIGDHVARRRIALGSARRPRGPPADRGRRPREARDLPQRSDPPSRPGRRNRSRRQEESQRGIERDRTGSRGDRRGDAGETRRPGRAHAVRLGAPPPWRWSSRSRAARRPPGAWEKRRPARRARGAGPPHRDRPRRRPASRPARRSPRRGAAPSLAAAVNADGGIGRASPDAQRHERPEEAPRRPASRSPSAIAADRRFRSGTTPVAPDDPGERDHAREPGHERCGRDRRRPGTRRPRRCAAVPARAPRSPRGRPGPARRRSAPRERRPSSGPRAGRPTRRRVRPRCRSSDEERRARRNREVEPEHEGVLRSERGPVRRHGGHREQPSQERSSERAPL